MSVKSNLRVVSVNSLYTRLFKYSPREGCLPLENFLTECICDFLIRLTALDRQASELFICEVLGGSKMPPNLLAALTCARELLWKTQQNIDHNGGRGFIDLCLLADNIPLLIIENKIDAGFTSHRATDDEDDSLESEDALWSQLEFYERYLTAKGGAAGLILLTHRTEPPKTFTEDGCVFRRVCRWSDVYRWLGNSQILDRCSLPGGASTDVLFILAGELRQFLEDKQLITKEWSSDDLDVMKTFFTPDFPNKLQVLFQSVKKPVGMMTELASYQGWPRRSPTFEVRRGIVWDWVYCFAPELKWFISWGIASKMPLLKGYGIELEAPFQTLVLIGSDGQDIPCSHAELENWREKGWTVYESLGSQRLRLVKAVIPDDLFALGSGFSASFETWVLQAVKEGASGLQPAFARYIKGKISECSTEFSPSN